MSSLVIRQSLVPMIVFYIVIMATLAAGLRMSRRAARAPRPGPPDPPAGGATAARRNPRRRLLAQRGPGWQRLIILYAGTAGGGYLLLMAVVLIYYFGVARVGGNFIESAVSGCALLLGLSTPVFFLATWLTARRR